MMKGYPPMKLKVFVDDVIAFMEGQNQELEIIAEKVLRAMRREEKKGLKLFITEGGKERRSKTHCFMQLFGREVS